MSYTDIPLVTGLEAASLTRPVAASTVSPSPSLSFGRAGLSGFLWQHQLNGTAVRWEVDVAGQVADWSEMTPPDEAQNWQLVAAGDFDRDGRDDYLWRSAPNHLWQTHRLQLANGRAIDLSSLGVVPSMSDVADTAPPMSDPKWQIVGVADFDDDQQLDLLWRHQGNGANRIWRLNAGLWTEPLGEPTAAVAPLNVRSVSDPDWQIRAVVDWNGDGHPDILWQYQPQDAAKAQFSGRNALWLMRANQIFDNPELPALPDPEWHLSGATDVNQDGAVDLLWWHQRLGLNVAWLMQGNQRQASLTLPSVPDTSWQLAAVLPAPPAVPSGLNPIVARSSRIDAATVPSIDQFEFVEPEIDRALPLPVEFDRSIRNVVMANADPLYQPGQALPLTIEFEHQAALNDRFKLSFFLSEDPAVSVRDRFLSAATVAITPDQAGASTWQQTLVLPDINDAIWQSGVRSGEQTIYLGVLITGLYGDREVDVSNNRSVLPLEFALPPLVEYDYAYYYSGEQDFAATASGMTAPNGDHYVGRGVAYAGTYAAGQWVDARRDDNQARSNGRYRIIAVKPYDGARSVGWVQVTDYFDHESGQYYRPQAAVGDAYLGSESGYIRVRQFNQDRFGQDFYEADVWDVVPPTAPIRVVPRRQDVMIAALMNPFGRYWDTQASGGIITYSFYQPTSGPYAGQEVVTPVNVAVQQNVRQILAQLEQVIAVEFVEVAETADRVGQIRYMYSDGAGQPFYAYSYYPDQTVGGDVHLNQRGATQPDTAFGARPGSYGYRTLLHETLHALGLKHPGAYDAVASNALPPYLAPSDDNTTNTVMSYNSAGFRAITPMNYDLAALQSLYGTPVNNTANTTYQFSDLTQYRIGMQQFGVSTQLTKQTIWDGGGVDTLDFSALSIARDNWFDLRPGGILTAQAAYDTKIYRDLSTNQQFSTSEYGVVLSGATLVENFVNSVGNDLVIANVADNQFRGYRLGRIIGDDVIVQAGSRDQLWLEDYQLADIHVAVNQRDLLLKLADDGTIRILDYFEAPLQIRLNDRRYRYDRQAGWVAWSL